MDGDSACQRQQVRYSLGHLDAQEAAGGKQDPDSRNKEDTLTRGGQECGWGGTTNGLLHHITHNDPALSGKTDALETQGGCAAGNDCRVIPEQSDKLRRENKHQGANGHQEAKRGFDAEPKSLLYSLIEFGTVI